MKKYRVGLIGASGLVSHELKNLIAQKNLPWTLSLAGREATAHQFKGCDWVFFCAPSSASKTLTPALLKEGIKVIDLSSAFRMKSDVPLIIPEINGDLLKKDPLLIASPNCTTTLLLMALYPWQNLGTFKKVVVATYQAVSGGGRKKVDALINAPSTETLDLMPHESPLNPTGENEEEEKIRREAQKILEIPTLNVVATCIRVPILRAHSLALHVTFDREIPLTALRAAIDAFPGITYVEDRPLTPQYAQYKGDVFCARLRQAPQDPKSILLWIVGDQLLKGAALNALQIAETICTNPLQIV